MKTQTKFYLVIALTIVAAILVLPREDKILSKIGLHKQLKITRGLDLQGGAYLTYQADTSKLSAADKTKALDGVVNVITKRVNPAGTSEVVVQTSSGDRVVVQLPGVTNVNDAINLIGKTAELKFYEVPASGDKSATTAMVIPTDLSGKDLKTATTGFDSQSTQPIISFEMKSDSVQKFADLTTRINKEGGRLLITLDDQTLFNGTVSSPITDGKGQMQGFTSLADAKQKTVLLNAGALPVPVKLVAQSTVGATLGTEAVDHSIIAGIIGLLAVMIFMIIYYRLAGLMASAALIIYTMLNVAIFKLSVVTPWTIVLTLAGIAGFILSIGMAVDANILIFERMKEEAREGKSLNIALNDGFSRAWTSIKDSNISTLITCLILYWFGAPIIKGFAITLAIGVLVSMFTAITISRTFMQMILNTRLGQNPRAYGIRSYRKGNS